MVAREKAHCVHSVVMRDEAEKHLPRLSVPHCHTSPIATHQVILRGGGGKGEGGRKFKGYSSYYSADLAPV